MVTTHGGFRPGAGRKLTGRRKIHGIKFTDEEWEIIREMAIKNGFVKSNGQARISEYIRSKALEQK